MIAAVVAAAIGVKEEPGQSLLVTLTGALRNRRLLLLLDNCEHVLDDAARLCDALLRACPGVQVLATSRAALGIAGEQAYRLRTLTLPDSVDARRTATPERLEQYEAVRLFVDRAIAVRSDFAVTNANAPAVAQICWRLDGIPLAIELAAARVKALPVEQIAARLGDQFRLLTGGSRTAMPRQQTLRALIDWSWNLLDDREKMLLARFSVFAGGATMPAAEQVCADGSGIEDWEILDLLQSMVDKSLVVYDEAATEAVESRYRLLETVRQYAAEQLAALGADEVHAARMRHAACYEALIRPLERGLFGNQRDTWKRRLRPELDNFRAARVTLWANSSPSSEQGKSLARLVVNCAHFFANGLFIFAGPETWVRETVALMQMRPEILADEPAAAADLSSMMGYVYQHNGNNVAARAAHEEALTLRRRAGIIARTINTLIDIAWAESALGNVAVALNYMEEAVAMSRAAHAPELLNRALCDMGSLLTSENQYAAAASVLQESLQVSRTMQDMTDAVVTLVTLSKLEITREGGYSELARQYAEMALAEANSAVVATWCRGLALSQLGVVEASRERYIEASQRFSEASEVMRQHGEIADASGHDIQRAIALVAANDLDTAISLTRNVLVELKPSNFQPRIQFGEIVMGLALTIRNTGTDSEEAAFFLRNRLRESGSQMEAANVGNILTLLASLDLRLGLVDRALVELTVGNHLDPPWPTMLKAESALRTDTEAQLRIALGDKYYEAAVKEATIMPVETAIEYALGEKVSPG